MSFSCLLCNDHKGNTALSLGTLIIGSPYVKLNFLTSHAFYHNSFDNFISPNGLIFDVKFFCMFVVK